MNSFKLCGLDKIQGITSRACQFCMLFYTLKFNSRDIFLLHGLLLFDGILTLIQVHFYYSY